MKVIILTDGDPDALSGGSLYHRRISEHLGRSGVDAEIRSLGRRRASSDEVARASVDADVVVVDSIVASHVRPAPLAVPVVASVHQRPGGLVGSAISRRRLARLDVRCYREARRVVVPSAFMNDLLLGEGIAQERIRVVQPGRDLDGVVGAAPSRRSRSNGTSYVCVANLSTHKRSLDLLAAFAALDDVDATLMLVGAATDPRLADRVRERLGGRDLAGRARWLGPRSPHDVAEILLCSDVFVLPAVEEAYGMAVAEALALGVPAVVAGSGNLPELVRDGVDGIVVAPDDVAALADAMRRLAREPALLDAMSAAARRGASRFPTWDATARRFGDVLWEAQAAVTPREDADPSSLR